MNLVGLIACVFGLVSGVIAARFATMASARLGDGGFWRQLSAVSRLLVLADEDTPFFREYMRLWPALIGFVARQVAVGLAATSPIGLAFVCVAVLARVIGGSWAMPRYELTFACAACASAVLGIVVLKCKS